MIFLLLYCNSNILQYTQEYYLQSTGTVRTVPGTHVSYHTDYVHMIYATATVRVQATGHKMYALLIAAPTFSSGLPRRPNRPPSSPRPTASQSPESAAACLHPCATSPAAAFGSRAGSARARAGAALRWSHGAGCAPPQSPCTASPGRTAPRSRRRNCTRRPSCRSGPRETPRVRSKTASRKSSWSRPCRWCAPARNQPACSENPRRAAGFRP